MRPAGEPAPDASARGERLLLVGDYPPPWGGIAVHVRSLLELALDRGFDARVLDVGRGRRERRASRVIPAGGGPSFAARLGAAAAAGARLHAHVSGNNTKAWLVALAAGRARRPGGPGALLTVHSGLAPAYLAGGAARRRLARTACAGFARVLCANDGIARALAGAGVPAPRLEVLPAFAPGGGNTPGAAPAAAVVARARHRPLVVAALAPGPQYGEDVLLAGLARCVSRFPGAGLVVFGPGTADPSTRARVAAAGLAARVTALGELDHPAALGAMRLADVFVRSTRADGDSISVREALGLGVRVVASDVGHRPPGVVTFPAGDAAALAAAIEAALARPPPEPAVEPDASARIVELWRGAVAASPKRVGAES